MFAKRYNADELIDIIAAPAYSPELIEYVKKLANAPYLSQFLSQKPKLGITGTIAKDYVSADTKDAVPYVSTKQVKGLHAYMDDAKYISKEADIEWAKCRVDDGDIIINKSGNVGAAAVLCCAPYKYVNSVSDIINIKLDKTASIDRDFLVVYLNSPYGQKQLQRLSGGAIFSHVSLHAIPDIRVYHSDIKAQKYIGDKVRQAEQLRAWAKRLALSIEDLLTSSDDYLSACRTPEKKTTRPQLIDLSNRLDPKYYGNKAIAVHRFTRKTGTPLAALIKSVANGFEERSFIENGLAYITVSEVSSGRLDAQSAPKISKSIDVPQKAVIHETCVLVVRTGSIGTAVKVHALDKGCAISSHLIRLEFEDEETAAAVAVFLNSSAGKVLLHKISYGAVQPQIGQEELLALNIPEYVLNEKTQCLALLNSYELAIRASKSLTVSAKNLVEALIEGQLTEQQLIQAQQALEDGDNSLDQAILSKLSAEGYAIEGATPLFSDVDELYSLLEDAAQAEAEE
ncbi:restriction endonuclease subunit S [Pantoea agglomerans]|uniref:restriction endonuclease subunit S n=1 Tax=Enterobacter agglomerans TaxID=549 RepID=UPI00320A1679